MEPAVMIAPLMMSYMMTSAAPIALMMSGGELDKERLARGVVQLTVMGMRSVMDVTYEDILLDDRTGDFSIRGLNIALPDASGLIGCTVSIEAVTILPLGRVDEIAFSSQGDGIVIDPACAADQGPMILSMLGPDAMNITHYSSTGSYKIGSSTYDFGMLLETAAAGSVSVNARIEGLHLDISGYGDPMPAGKITEFEVTLQDTDALRELLPVLGIEDDPVAMATGSLQGMLGRDGISPDEQALIDSANSELSRVVNNGGAVTLRSGPGIEVSFKQLEQTNGPEDIVPLLRPVFSSALLGADNLIPAALLKQAITSPGDLSAADQLKVASALATGEGAPRAVAMAATMLKPLADGGNAEAAMHYAALLQADETDPNAAYRYAMMAGAGGAVGARTLLDRVEGTLPLPAILELQGAMAGEAVEPEADVPTLRNMARQYAQGRGAPRNYARAFLLASLAGAAGDHSSALLVERLSKRFADDEDSQTWRDLEAAQSDTALKLWSSGFGDAFAAQ